MPITGLDAWASGTTDGTTYSISSGDDRLLVVCISEEASSITEDNVTCTYGDQSMTKAVHKYRAASFDAQVKIFYLKEAGIAAATGTAITFTGEASSFVWGARSLAGVDQTTPVSATDTDENGSTQPNDVTVTVDANGAFIAAATSGDDATADWTGGDTTEGYDALTGTMTGTGSELLISGIGGSKTAQVEFTDQNRMVIAGIALSPADVEPVISSIDTDNDTVDTRSSVAIAGVNFGATETGSAKVEVGSSATYGTTETEIDATAWGATSVTVTLEAESDGHALDDDFTLPLDPAYLWVTDSAGARNTTGFQFTLKPAGATWLAVEDTDVNIDVTSGNVQKRLRVEIKNTGGTGTSIALRWTYSHNSGSYTTLTASSTHVQTVASASPYFVDGDDVTEKLLSGSDTLITNNDAQEESTGVFTVPSFTGGQVIEAELSFVLVASALANNDTIDFRVEENDGTDLGTYSQTPRVTITKGAGGANPRGPLGHPLQGALGGPI